MRFNGILRREIVKNSFLFFLVLLGGMTGLSAVSSEEGGGDNTPQMIIPQVDITVSIATSVMPAPMRPGVVSVMANKNNKAAFTQDIELICLWFDQYREGLLTANDFKTLVAGRITVLYMKEQILRGIVAAKTAYPIDRTGGMRIRAAETRKKINSHNSWW